MEALEEFVVQGQTSNYLDFATLLNRAYSPAQAPEHAFAPPAPAVLPEVPITAPRAPPVVLPALTAGVASLLGGLFALVFPTPIGGGDLPPPGKPPDAAPDPLEPPNWEDISQPRPGVDYGDPVRFPGLPIPSIPPELPVVELPEFLINPPAVSPRPYVPTIELPYAPGPHDYTQFGDPGSGLGAPPRSPDRITDLPGETLEPVATPERRPVPRPTDDPAPFLFDAPFADPFGDAVGDPAAPSPFDAPPGTSPRAPDRFAIPTPFDPLGPSLDLIPDPLSTPLPPKDTPPIEAGCGCKKKPKKKAKERPPRAVCWRGTYVQRAKGISYTRREQVPCAGSAKRPSSSSLLSLVSLGSSAFQNNPWDVLSSATPYWASQISKAQRAKKKRDAKAKAAAKRKAARAKHAALDKSRAAKAKARLAKVRAESRARIEKERARTRAARMKKRKKEK